MPFNFLNQGQTDDAATRFQPIDTFIDPVSKIRVSNPANLIDTDFEYGLQPTKWETVEIINNTPAFFSKSGDTTIPDITGVTTNGGTREITVTTAFPHNLDVGIPIRVSGTKSLTADGSYIINATPTATTFTYLARANQPETISIFDLYTSIITGEFFQGSQISISDAEGMTTDGQGPSSTLTIKTQNKHGFGPKTPFYFLNINSTVSQEFESQNSTSLAFDPTNSASAQSFDGSNTLLQTPVDLSNSATNSIYQNSITSTNPTDSTITVSINPADAPNWSNIIYGDPLYYDVNVGSGYFQANPRGVVFIKNTAAIDVSNNTATFQVSERPDSESLPILANMTGYFQIADQARTFAGNNVNEQSQIEFQIENGISYVFDGGNQGYDGVLESPPSNEGTVVGYTGTNVSLFSSEGVLDYYVGAMLQYIVEDSSEGAGDAQPASGLTSGASYFVTSFSAGASAGLFNMSIAEFPGGNNINISGGAGVQKFSKIGISADKDIVHVRNSNFEESDMLEYISPENGRFGADVEKSFYFVEVAYDAHNYKLSEDVSFTPVEATGGDSVVEIYDQGRIWKLHRFTSTGTSNFEVANPGKEGEVEYLIVAGGGAGASRHGGGGGAGGLLSGTITVSTGNYPVVVGAGGTATRQDNSAGDNGDNSSAFGLTAIGGGGGGVWDGEYPGRSGGSGGGAAGGTLSGNRNRINGGAGTAGQGNNGGTGVRYTSNGENVHAGGGGGGASSPGENGADSSINPAYDVNNGSGDGGNGTLSRITGRNVYYAGGGASGVYRSSTLRAGDGGLGGGGGGGRDSGHPGGDMGNGFGDTFGLNPASDGGYNRGGNAGANTGGGGGGNGGQLNPAPGIGGNGGSGVVFIRYPITEVLPDGEPSDYMEATGGTVTEITQNGIIYNVHQFTNVGSSTFEVTSQSIIPQLNEVEYLIVAGGGAGGVGNGNEGGGGGGAGGLVEGYFTVSQQSYTITVGGGGNQSGSTNSPGGNGGNSSAFGLTARGGGGGGGCSTSGASGGSGGGGSGCGQDRPGGGETQTSLGYGFGHYGGRGRWVGNSPGQGNGGGGGGAGTPGLDGRTQGAGATGRGGAGRFSDITGTNIEYAVGGDGAGGSGASVGATTTTPSRGYGGRGVNPVRSASNGGSGIVIIRYPIGVEAQV